MKVFRRNNVRFIAINNGIDSAEPSTLEFAPFINIMSEWYARDIGKKVKTGIKTKGTSGKPIAAEVVRLIFRLFMDGKNRNQIAVYLKNEKILTPTFYLKQHNRGTAESRQLNEENRHNRNKASLTNILTRQEYCGEYAKGKARHPKCHSPHRIDVDIVMQNIAEVLRKIAQYSLADKAGFEALVKNSLAKGQTDEMKKQQKHIPQITQKYAEEYYPLKKELEEIRARLSGHESQSQRAVCRCRRRISGGRAC